MSRSGPETSVLIAGGGIGGLAVAIALAARGIPSHVLERERAFSEAGAGIQLGPNAMRALAALGVERHLADALVRPEAVRLFDGLSGRDLATVPLGEAALARYGAPYCVAHRADLQAGLLAAARAAPEITITTGFEIVRYADSAEDVTVFSIDDRIARGAILIAADGISSRVRAQLNPGTRLSFGGRTAWRTLLPRADAPDAMRPRRVGLWMAPKAHLIHYPVRGGAMINLVAVIEDDWDREGWNSAAEAQELLPHFATWCAPPKAMLDAGTGWRKWALFSLTPLLYASKGRVVLMGDAAHPVLPFLAQGAGLAIEDAIVLAREVGRAGADPSAALDAFCRARRLRARQVQAASRRMGEIYHYRGLMRRARNMALAAMSPARHLARLDWLYGHDVT